MNNFNRTENQLNEHISYSLIDSTCETLSNANPTVERIKRIAAHGFEASQISNMVESFIAQNRIAQTIDVEKMIDRFTNHYPFLELYKHDALQGTIVADYILSLTSNYDICSNIFIMLPNLWSHAFPLEKLDNQMGYFGWLKQILACVNLYNAESAQHYGVQHFVSNVCHSFCLAELSVKLKQTETFSHFADIDREAYGTVEDLRSNVKHFDVFNKKDGNLLSYIHNYIMNMSKLLNLRNITIIWPEEILATDLFSLIGNILFDTESNISIGDVEGLVSKLNTNILHVLTKNTCPDIEISKRFIDPPDVLLERQLVRLSTNDATSVDADRQVFRLHRTDILNYVTKRNAVVAFFLRRIHNLSFAPSDMGSAFNSSFLSNLMVMRETDLKMNMYNDNAVVSALNLDYLDIVNLTRIIAAGEYE